ncbi:MAG: DUF2318 domain-containing protein [Clostridia bacterium]|nr:DUF2318 domain-containing protein [Clostridia bacterium]
MRRRMLLFALMALILALAMTACSSKTDAAAGAAQATEPEAVAGLVIDATTLTEAPTFVDWNQDGTAMQLIARKAEGQVRLAFNTCQSCGGSPYAWFEDLGDGNLQCQNCGLTFPLETVGTEKAAGCNPVTIADFIVEGDVVTIPAALLADNAARFANWKHFE